MIISHRHKFVYVKTRKTASTSLEIALSKWCGPQDIITHILATDEKVRQGLGYPGPQNYVVPFGPGRSLKLVNHTPVTVARQVLGDVWPDYFTFTIERNPFDRAISQYYWERALSQRSSIEQVTLSRFLANSPVELLSNWHLYGRGSTVLVDFVGRYETLADDLQTISERIGLREGIDISAIRTKDRLRSDRRHYREVLQLDDRRLIEEVCHREVEEFGYSW
ncbi:MAG: sulfotransferase family 2 domain-containing protein [Actinomycetes bacterium]